MDEDSRGREQRLPDPEGHRQVHGKDQIVERDPEPRGPPIQHEAPGVAGAVLALGALVPMSTLELIAAVLLLAFGAWKLRNYYRHPRWVGMNVNGRDLVWWSFLMATAHGAGLMVAPVLIAARGPAVQGHLVRESTDTLLLGVAIHTVAMLAVMALIAWVVYRKVGLAVLRSGWVNFDLIWACALLLVGLLALGHGVWGMQMSA